MTPSIRRVGAATTLTVLLLAGAACSSTDSTSDTTAAPESSTTTTEAGTSTTEGSGSSPLERLAKGSADQEATAQAEDLEQSFAASGLELTDEQTTCLAEFVAGTPELLDIGDDPTPAETELMFTAIFACVPYETFVDLVVGEFDDGSMTEDQLTCIREELLLLDESVLIGAAAEDEDALAELGTALVSCLAG